MLCKHTSIQQMITCFEHILHKEWSQNIHVHCSVTLNCLVSETLSHLKSFQKVHLAGPSAPDWLLIETPVLSMYYCCLTCVPLLPYLCISDVFPSCVHLLSFLCTFVVFPVYLCCLNHVPLLSYLCISLVLHIMYLCIFCYFVFPMLPLLSYLCCLISVTYVVLPVYLCCLTCVSLLLSLCYLLCLTFVPVLSYLCTYADLIAYICCLTCGQGSRSMTRGLDRSPLILPYLIVDTLQN